MKRQIVACGTLSSQGPTRQMRWQRVFLSPRQLREWCRDNDALIESWWYETPQGEKIEWPER